MKSASQHNFALTPSVNIGRTAMKRPCTYKTTMDAGKLYPVYLEETLPGDTVNLHLVQFTRFMTLITSLMDNVKIDLHVWYAPNRILTENWSKVLGSEDEPTEHPGVVHLTDLVPTIDLEGDSVFASGSLADYFGIPINVKHLSVSALPFRMYNLVWSEFYRDENLQDKPYLSITDVDETYDADKWKILPRGKRKDEFTGATPWPQKGPSVELPIGSTAPVVPDNANAVPRFHRRSNVTLVDNALISDGELVQFQSTNDDDGHLSWRSLAWDSGFYDNGGSKTGLHADLSEATMTTINEMREAFQIQRWFERNALAGTRINELILSHFGVKIPDARLQRPEYLGGKTFNINIHTVVQNSSTDATSPQGNLAGYGTSAGDLRITKSFCEHGWIMILASIRADVTYQQGLDQKWTRLTRFDFYWPVFAHLGEEPIFNLNVFAQGTDDDDGIFGYQERWYAYRYSKSMVTGKLRSGISDSLDAWHLAQNFTELPVLNASFIEENPPISRVVAVTSQPAFLYDQLVEAIWVRPMPMYSVPGLIDHSF